jgi:putative polymerase
LASTEPIARVERIFADSPESRWAPVALIIATISFNAVLCLLNTRGVAISNVHVMLSEAVLISAALLVCRNHLNLTYLTVLALVVAYTVIVSALRYANVQDNSFDPKITRDLVIPIVFFLLGTVIKEIEAADRVVFTATAILLAFAAFEYFFLDSFLRVFGVAEYYVARGTLESSDWALDVSQGLMVSGFRPADQGRTLLSFLGDHRVSSLFLEPSSLGNFGALVTIWAGVRSRMEDRLFLWCGLGGLTLLALSDTRFDAYFLVLATLFLMVPPRLTTPVVFLLPFVTIAALYILGATHAEPFNAVPMVDGRGVYDRLLYSGRILFDFNAYNWFGLESSRGQTFDSGYGYVISNVGIVGFAALWILFMSLQGANRFFYVFRNITALYFATMLCISASQFTIKIAALLWFLLGALSVAKVATEGRSPQRLVDAN